MINLANIAKYYGDRTLFSDVTVQLNAGARYGLVGANGSGKTTLLNILANEDAASDGDITMPAGTEVGVLQQDRYLSDQQRIIDVAMMGDNEAWQALAEQRRLLDADHADPEAVSNVEERISAANGYTLESRAASILEGLGIPAAHHPQALSTLSGGFKLRVLLAQTLIGKPDLLLLDEPTNHLDILTIAWLEDFLRKYPGCVVVISHDQRFLDAVTSDILDVDYETVTLYRGNYSAFVKEKQQTRERKESEIERQEKIVAEKKAFVERFRYKKTKARQAQSRLKQIDRIEIEELAQTSRRRPLIRFSQQRRSGRDVLSLDNISKAYGEKSVLNNVSLTVQRGEKIAIIGANGIGKSTLLKIIVERLKSDLGTVKWGYETSIAYFPQDHHELLDKPDIKVLDHLWDSCPDQESRFVRGQLGRLLFSGPDVDKKVGSLSGGEAARLIFCHLIIEKANVLVLDEPTNHLDLESIHALLEGLKDYPGTILLVSHDRWFVSELATRIIELTDQGHHDYPGNYDDYLQQRGDDHLDQKAVMLKAKAQRRQEREEASGTIGQDWQAQKQRRNRHRQLLARHEEVTTAIDEAEKSAAAIRDRYCSAGFFEQTPADEVAALQKQEGELEQQLAALMEEWERLETDLEDFKEPPNES